MQMIKHYAVLTLEHLLQGVPEERQEIFVTIRKVEEISYESEQATTNEERCEHRESTSNDNQENGGGDSKSQELIQQLVKQVSMKKLK